MVYSPHPNTGTEPMPRTKHKPTTRRFVGMPPGGDHAPLAVSPGRDSWTLYVTSRGANDEGLWVNLKLASNTPRSHKANFWVSYCTSTGRFGPQSDAALLARYQPELAEWVERVVALADADGFSGVVLTAEGWDAARARGEAAWTGGGGLLD